jgi:signal transduction histidine kinase
MPVPPRPEAIDSRLVFRVYAWIAIAGGLTLYAWGPMLLLQLHAPGLPYGRAAILRTAAAILAAAGVCALGFARVMDPVSRRRGLTWFAAAHFVFGGLFLLQWIAIFVLVLPPSVGWISLVAGVVLLYLALTGPGGQLGRAAMTIQADDGTVRHDRVSLRSKPSLDSLRSQYQEQIRQAVRQEERARLARDLHDAVKQQLFVIQTAAATAQARFGPDPDGARSAIDRIRESTREAMTEMEVMLDQLRAAPLENAGLVAALRQQCDALGFRTGADVTFEVGALPPEADVPPGAREAILRAAQEALSNVARHARARTVQVGLKQDGSDLVLTVRDDGSGFEPNARGHGMGLASLAARAQEVGGRFAFDSVRQRGTAVCFAVPCGHLPARQYLKRAAFWSLPLIAGALLIAAGGPRLQPWGAASAAIAAIAVARYAVAGYRVRRSLLPA